MQPQLLGKYDDPGHEEGDVTNAIEGVLDRHRLKDFVRVHNLSGDGPR